MVGRNKRTHTVAKKEVEAVSEEEIVCIDVPTKNIRKSKTVRNFKAKKTEKKSAEEENAFAGFDVDGVSAEEKEQIKEAILASTKERAELKYADTNGDEGGLNTLQKPESPNSSVGELSTDTSKIEDCRSEINPSAQELAVQDDEDETQPPSDSDIEEIQLGLDLKQSTLEVSRDDIFDTDSTSKEDTDTTLRDDDIYKIEIEDVENGKKACDDTHTRNRDLKKSELPENECKEEGDVNMSDTFTESKITQQLNESGDSQGFDPDMQMDVEKDSQTESRLRTRRSVSQESLQQKDLPKDQEKSSSQKSLSQGNMDSVKSLLRSSGSQKNSETSEKQSSRSDSQDIEIQWEHVPLIRHYRSTRPEIVNNEQYFRTSETEELEKSALAIYQLFEIYRTKLHVAQRKLREKVTWAEPIKSGQHQSRTIDVKKRGKESIYVDLSDEDESIQDKTLESVRGRLPRNPNSKSENNSDELPELVIESENSWESFTLGRLARKPLGTRVIDKEIMSADTQPYDIDNNDDEDFVIEAKTRRGRGRPRAGTSKDILKEKGNVNDKENVERPTRGRLGRRLGLNGGKSETKVLVEDTQQEDLDLQEAIRRSKSDSQRSIEETQDQDDDFDWLNVNKIGGKEEFENQMHKAKLKGYSIPKVGQKHSKGHQKIVYPEKKNEDEDVAKDLEDEHITKTKSNCHTEEMTEDIKESKPPTRGRKRKAKRQGVTLVEDTQDLDAEESGLNRLRGKKKRNCFKIDSESEGESIAESQDIDGSPDHDLDDKKQSNKGYSNRDTEKKKKSFMSSVLDKVKNFVSPSKNQQIEENDNEGSQSPVISRKKLYNCASKKMYSKPCDRNDTEYETDAFKEYKAKSAEKKFKNANTSSTNTRKGRVQMPATENYLVEENGIPEGVKRFISRPSSKDSNASDNLSTTSSQMSTNILDEKGDLYSTQYCEIKTRKGKDLRPKGHPKRELKEEVEEILLLDDSDEDISVLNEPKKTYSVRNSNKKFPVIKGARVVGKTNQPVTKNENIRQYFSEVKKPDDEDVTIDLDLDENEPEQRQNGRRDIKGDINDTDDVVEGKYLVETSSGKSGNIKEINQSSVKAHTISVPDIATEHEVVKVKADINHIPIKFDKDVSPELKNKRNISKVKGQHGETNTLHHLDIESDNPPVMLNDLNSARGDRIHGLDQNNRGARPKTRNIETDTDMFEPRPTNRRRRKVSETVTSADLGEGTRESTRNRHGDQDLENYLETGNLRNGSRKRAGEHHMDEEDNHVKKKMEKVECPMCGRSYPASVIQQHAATCEGHVESEEDNDGMDEKEYLAHMAQHYPHMSEQELMEHLSKRHQHQFGGHDRHHRMQHQYMSPEEINEDLSQQDHLEVHHLNHMEGLHGHHVHHGHLEGLHGHGEHLHDTDEMIHHDEHVKDIAKHISCSPGEEGEVEVCYICDAQVPKGKPYEIHLNRCLTIAAQQQAEVDKKGYNQVYAEPEVEEEVQVRILRGRQVTNEESNTPSRASVSRAGRDASPVGRRRQKRELGRQSPSGQSGHEDERTSDRGNLSDPEELENPTGAVKRLVKSGNRNKAALNDDGSGPVARN
ncbi:uncharacterized protein LOC123546738 isoform X2 [Mercenaria mercenaria]|uniref:uncharacterized protein LOC123546738 isoform X2 n=1 Tax=Mercenaria mercenaria TaxID=6596 RepID=UPI00234F85B2|nr:uncharacterized protein LOC123546738 isoform X2 [Mercenaria mercenaria]